MAIISMLMLIVTNQHEADPIPERGVDYVSLRSERPLFGVVIEHTKRETSVVAQRQWLKVNRPDLYEKHRTNEVAREQKRRATAVGRLEKWIDQTPPDSDLRRHLRSELRRLSDSKPGATQSQFVLLRIPGRRVRAVRMAKPERRRVALLAYRERFANVETTSAKNLSSALAEKGVRMPDTTIDLRDRMPPVDETDRQWAARQAIVEHGFGLGIDLVGTPELLVRDNADRNAGLAQLIKQFAGRVGSLPGTPGRSQPGGNWRDKAIGIARTTKARGVRVSIVKPDPSLRKAVVRVAFLARLPKGEWIVVRDAVSETVPGEQPDLEERIRADPELAPVLKLLGQLGADDAVSKAVRFGAATMAAQQKAGGEFEEWRAPYLRSVDKPAIRIRKPR